MAKRKQKKIINFSNIFSGLNLIIALFTLYVAVFALITIQDVKIAKTTSDLNFCPQQISGCGASRYSYCGDENSFNMFCDDSNNDLRIGVEIYNKGLALATEVILLVQLDGEIYNFSETSYTAGFVGHYVNEKQTTEGHIPEDKMGPAILYEFIGTIKPQDVSKVLFVYSGDVFLKKPSKITYLLYENNVLLKEKTFIMNYTKK